MAYLFYKKRRRCLQLFRISCADAQPSTAAAPAVPRPAAAREKCGLSLLCVADREGVKVPDSARPRGFGSTMVAHLRTWPLVSQEEGGGKEEEEEESQEPEETPKNRRTDERASQAQELQRVAPTSGVTSLFGNKRDATAGSTRGGGGAGGEGGGGGGRHST